MSFTPFARFRNFTLTNLKSLLEVYPDMARNVSWEEAKDFAEGKLKGYKRTAYQQACQLGLEDRSTKIFRMHNYLYTFDDNNLSRYLVFWFKTYFAPNPYVNSNDDAFLLYCRLCEDILQSEKHSISFEKFVEKNIGGKSDDIFLNAIKAYATPVKYQKSGNDSILYISEEDVSAVESEIAFIKTNFPIADVKSEHDFFERYSYQNFCKFYKEAMDPTVKDCEEPSSIDSLKKELPFTQSKKCARQLVDCIYNIDKFKRLSTILENNDSHIKIVTDDLGGNYLRYMFAKPSSDMYTNDMRVFTDKDYEISIGDDLETCRLSNQWVSSDPIEGKTSGLFLRVLIEIINAIYSDFLRIYEVSGKWYIEFLTKEFKLEELPNYLDGDFTQRYISSLIAKPFVILTGNSGTGKTRIAISFAKYMEVTDENGEKNWLIVPVGADWTDNLKVLGFYNPLADNGKGKYEKTKILELIERANDHKDIPFFLVLDEMNLSHVERYFSDFLSHMERTDSIFELDGYERTLSYPDNLFVVGTVNIDETTYMFSPKVLDRANVIEFKPDKNDVINLFNSEAEKTDVAPADNGAAAAFLKLSREIRNGKSDALNDPTFAVSDKVTDIFSKLYDITEKQGFEFAFRTVREIKQYISAAYELQEDKSVFDLDKTIDEQIVQKILPKIHGNKKEIGELLAELKALCPEDKMPLSFNKIDQMERKLRTVQYASFI